MNSLADISAKLKAQTAVDPTDVKSIQNVLNETIKAVNSTNEKTRKQATAELKAMNDVIKQYGKGLGQFQASITDHLVDTIKQVESRRDANDTSNLGSLVDSVTKQAGGLTRTILNEYSKRNPLVYTGLKLFDKMKGSLVRNDKKGKTVQEKQLELLDLQFEVAEKQKEMAEETPAKIKKRSAPVVERLDNLKSAADEQIKVLSEIKQSIEKDDAPTTKKDLTHKEIAKANKELKQLKKANMMQNKQLEREAKASEAMVKIEKERLVDESKNALMEKHSVDNTPVAPIVEKQTGQEADKSGLGALGQVFFGTFFGELLEHMVAKGGIMAIVKGLVKTVGGSLLKGLSSAKSLGKLAGKILLPLSVGLAAWDGFKAYNDDKKIAKILDKEAKDIQMSDRIMAAISGFTGELIGGTIDSIASLFGFDTNVEGFIFTNMLKLSNGLIEGLTSAFDTEALADKIGRELSFGEKLVAYMTGAGTSLVSMVLGAIDSVFDTSFKKAFLDIKDSILARLISWKDSLKERLFGPDETPARPEVKSEAKPKAMSNVQGAKQIDKTVEMGSSMNQSAVAVSTVKQSTNINNQVFQGKTISPRNTDTTVNVLSYR